MTHQCDNCNSEVSFYSEYCTTCGNFLGFPNVRAADKPKEVEALKKRYENAIENSLQKDAFISLFNFEKKVLQSQAVINVNIDYLYTFIKNDKALYSTYCLQVEGEVRKSASARDDIERLTIESMIFGDYGKNIRYAALSVDGAGLKSYGAYTIILKEVAIENRATLLEDNSYHFIKKHDLQLGNAFPLGYRCTWQKRNQLAVAKLEEHITANTSEKEYVKILLSGNGKRETDEFIEVHIYGPFDNKAIANVKGKTSFARKDEKAMLAVVKEYLAKAGKTWLEE